MSTMVGRLFHFARAHWKWLLWVPPLTLLCVFVHVMAWVAAALCQGAHVTGFTFWPIRAGGRVMFGSMETTGLPGGVLPALAPYVVWTLIAFVGIVWFAVRGRARSAYAERLTYIFTVVLPVLSIVMNLSTFISGAHSGSDAVDLRDHRLLVAAVGLLVCAATIAIGWLRFRVAFSSLLVRDYVIGWILLATIAGLARNSGSIWSALSTVAVDERSRLWAPPPGHDVDWGSPAPPTDNSFQVTAIHVDITGDILIAADVANGTRETLYYFPRLHGVRYEQETHSIVALFGFERPTAPMNSSAECHVGLPEFRALAPGERARLTDRVQKWWYEWRQTGSVPVLDTKRVDPASLKIVIKVAYSDRPLSLKGTKCGCWFQCGKVLADLQREVVTRAWTR